MPDIPEITRKKPREDTRGLSGVQVPGPRRVNVGVFESQTPEGPPRLQDYEIPEPTRFYGRHGRSKPRKAGRE
jgi:hypothetical protein